MMDKITFEEVNKHGMHYTEVKNSYRSARVVHTNTQYSVIDHNKSAGHRDFSKYDDAIIYAVSLVTKR